MWLWLCISDGGDQQTCSATGEDCAADNSLTRSSMLIDTGGDKKERACDSLIMCILTTLNQGLRNGGGIGDILRAPSSQVSIYTTIISDCGHK